MNIFDRLLAPFKAAPKQPGQLFPVQQSGSVPLSPLSGGLGFPGWPDRSGKQASTTDLQRAKIAAMSTWVFADVQAISRELSAADIELHKPGGKGKDATVDAHPFLDVWRHPNPHMGRGFLMQYWCWQLLLFGEAYLYFAPSGNAPDEVWPVPSATMRPVEDELNFISGYRLDRGADREPFIIDPTFICFSRLPNPFNPRRGLSPLAAAYLAIETDQAQAKWNRDFFGEAHGVPTSIVSVPKETNNSDYLRIRDEIRENFGGGQRKTAVIRAGDMDVKSVQALQKDMEFLSGRQFSSSEIDRAFGIPEGFWSKSASRANSQSAKAVMLEQATWPLAVLLAEDLNTQIFPQWYSESYTVAFDDIRPRDVQLELQQTTVREGFWTINELREADGKDPLPDDDGRGKLFVIELTKGMTDAATPEEKQQQAQEQQAQQQAMIDQAMQQEGGQPNGEPQAPASTADTSPAATGEPQGNVFAEQKTADLKRWERKALARLKSGKSASTTFESEHINDAEAEGIRQALQAAGTAEAVKAAFQLAGKGAYTGATIHLDLDDTGPVALDTVDRPAEYADRADGTKRRHNHLDVQRPASAPVGRNPHQPIRAQDLVDDADVIARAQALMDAVTGG